MVDDIGLDMHFLSQAKENKCSAATERSGQRSSALHLHLFESLSAKTKKEHHPFGWCSFLVDDIGLEPMTFRTSSGCSSQLS